VSEAAAKPRSQAAAAGLFLDKVLGRWLIVLGIAAVSLVLGYIGLNEYLSHQPTPMFGRSWTDILYYDLQLLVLNSAPAGGTGPFPVTLGIARFLAPAVTVVATVATVRLLLSEQLRRWSSASASKHAIVTGDGPIAVELARKLRAEYRKVVLVSVTPATAEQVRAHRLLDVSGDPTDAGTLRAAGLRHANVLYACAELSTTNAATALRAREISQAHGRSLIAFAQVRDAEISTALRARRIGVKDDASFRLDFFSVEDTAARVLLDKHPLAPDGTRPAQVVIVGFGRLGRAVLHEIARRPHPEGSPLRVSIRGAGTEALPDFLNLFPVVLRNCSVTCDDDAPQRSTGGEPALIFICLPDNDDALNAGLAAAHAMTTRSDRVVICMSEPSPFGAVLSTQQALLGAEGRLTVFEVIEEACVPERIREDLADQLARAIHRAYVKNCEARGDSPRLNHSMRPWEDLPDHLKQSNLAQAADIGAKLDAIDCIVVPESATIPDFAFSEPEISLLAEMEHLRWVQERKGQGFVYGPIREGNQHPDLVDWQYLSESAQAKDRDAIGELPMILWQAGFQILRLPPQS
jgi:TrkA-N domain